jgi:DnaD/phage-associated family protein
VTGPIHEGARRGTEGEGSSRNGSAAFAGFPSRPQATAIPNVFFTDVLPALADPVALGVALFAFNVLGRKKGFPRYVTRADLDAEAALAAYLANAGAARDAIDAGLNAVVESGILLALPVETEGRRTTLYFLNAPADRRGMDAVRRGDVELGHAVEQRAAPPARSGIFALYESLVGTMSPLIADDLAEAERLYPGDWLERAFREAAAQNARSWRYVSRILERWASEGPPHEKAGRDPAGDAVTDRYYSGKYGRILKQRLNP